MKILFLTIVRFLDIKEHELYQDLMRVFRDKGHDIYIVSPRERRYNETTSYKTINGCHILGVKTFNLQKTNIIEKGLGTLLIERQFKMAIERYLANVDFDLIIYSTPPITFPNVIKYLKDKHPTAKTYLLLKDIFPQNAVDLGMLKTNGVKGFIYRYFRKKEIKLYSLSDNIGCMSPANVKYILKHNPEIAVDRVEVVPNCIELHPLKVGSVIDKKGMRKKYGLPYNETIFIYGGNLGKPQGIPFLINCLDANTERKNCHFLIIGDGVEYEKIRKWYSSKKPSNVTLIKRLPKLEFDYLTGACDVGLVFLDHRFTIPNFPSRLLSYLINKLPVLVASDSVSDMGPIAESNGFGYWCESNNVSNFSEILDKMLASNIHNMGEKGYAFLCDNYLPSNAYNTIIKHIQKK